VGDGAALSALDAASAAVAQFTLESTRNVQISDRTFQQVRDALADDRQLVELVGVIASYNMVSRVLVAFDVQPE
jgi:alkylhydroperoxidase family enzyme